LFIVHIFGIFRIATRPEIKGEWSDKKEKKELKECNPEAVLLGVSIQKNFHAATPDSSMSMS
jgi:hypothetical protein